MVTSDQMDGTVLSLSHLCPSLGFDRWRRPFALVWSQPPVPYLCPHGPRSATEEESARHEVSFAEHLDLSSKVPWSSTSDLTLFNSKYELRAIGGLERAQILRSSKSVAYLYSNAEASRHRDCRPWCRTAMLRGAA